MNLDKYWHNVAAQAVTMCAQQKVNEFAALLDLVARTSPKVIVEIGVADGATLWAWQHIAPTVIGIDNTPQDTSDNLIVGDSHDPATHAALVERLDGQPIDVLFIDGDHSYDGVRTDYEHYSPLVAPGGLIAFHDIITSAEAAHRWKHGVATFWAEMRDQHNAQEFIDATPGSGAPWGDQWGGIGVLTA